MVIAEWSLSTIIPTHEPFILFSLPSPSEEESDRTALVAPGVQPEPNHLSTKLQVGMSCEGQQRSLSLSPLERRRLRSDPIFLYSFLRRESGEDGAEIHSLVSSDKGVCGNGSELHQSRFRLWKHLDLWKHLFTFFSFFRVVKHRNSLPWVLVNIPSLSV